MNNEIVAGLKNAVERGVSLDSAVQSFINSGYNPVEVKEAARILSSGGGASQIVNPTNAQSTPQPKIPVQNVAQRKNASPVQTNTGKPVVSDPSTPTQKKSKRRIIIIGLATLFLLGFIGALIYLVYILLV